MFWPGQLGKTRNEASSKPPRILGRKYIFFFLFFFFLNVTVFFMHFKLVHFMLATLTLVKWQWSVWRVDLLPVPC